MNNYAIAFFEIIWEYYKTEYKTTLRYAMCYGIFIINYIIFMVP